ncbi:regulatory protein RecX [Rhodobacteraceae bacterium RKSG542]|uniref:regulatory protein RecX n=1 Tax=Pseudovibrio flavus TaxID=2529854 RepID=UPI0012BD0E80|nr:regulatory protein RecX [Pseudovibrio flavus]MTI17586.1 regulatory protein RecX [Pseudovibrio flavus]
MQEREWELDDPSALIEQVVLWCSEHGFVDDEAYCQSRIRVGQTKGKSQARLSQELVFKGADKDVVSSALEESEHDDQKAALYYARRRGLGPFARKDREEKHDKHLASLLRAGFSYSLAKQTLEYSFDEAQDILLGFPAD